MIREGMIEIEIKRPGTQTRYNPGWHKTLALDTPYLRSKLCANPKCFRYVGTKYRAKKSRKKYCSRECAYKGIHGWNKK